MLRALEAIAAVVVVGALVTGTLILRSSSMGQAPDGTASPSASGVPSLPNPTVLITPTAPPSKSSSPSAVAKWTGLSWSAPSAIPGASSITDIAYYNGQYIAAGRAGLVNSSGGQLPVGIWRSTDGTTWTQVRLDSTMFYNANIAGLVATDTLGLVAWGTAGDPVCSGEGEGTTCGPIPVMIWTSPNGIDWSRVADLTMFKDATIQNIAYGSLGLVAAGDTGFNQPAIWVSHFGSSWERQTLDAAVFKDAHFSRISATVPGYVIGGSTGGTAPTSGGVELPSTGVAAAWWFDGQTWGKATVNRTDGIGTDLGAIYVGAHGMLALGQTAGPTPITAWTSSDGRTWQPIDEAASPLGLLAFIFGSDGTRIVAVAPSGSNGKVAVWVTDDGVTWTQMAFSGSTGTLPAGPIGAQMEEAFMVPGGFIFVDRPWSSSTADVPVWMVTAQP